MSTANPYGMQPFPPLHLMEYNSNQFLLNQIKNQVEYYFAPENLKHDKFLQSQLQATEHLGAVPIQVICGFRKIRQLYFYSRSDYYPQHVDMPADPALLRVALVNSNVVRVSPDGMWIIPIPPKDSPTEATTPTIASTPSSPSSSQEEELSPSNAPLNEANMLVIQQVSENVTEAMISEAFDNFKPKSVQKGAGNTWYVQFGTGADAVAALKKDVSSTMGVNLHRFLKSDVSSVPGMPLPPAAQVGSHPHQYPQHIPMYPYMNYGFAQPPYGMAQVPMPQQMNIMQQMSQPQYRYFAPPSQRQPGVPPQNVFVKPTPPAPLNNDAKNTGSTNGRDSNRRRGNAKKKIRNKQQPKEQPIASRNDVNESKSTRGKNPKSSKNLDLGDNHFPALGGNQSVPRTQVNVVQGAAYAKVLLKSAAAEKDRNTPKPVQDLQKDLSNMAVSKK